MKLANRFVNLWNVEGLDVAIEIYKPHMIGYDIWDQDRTAMIIFKDRSAVYWIVDDPEKMIVADDPADFMRKSEEVVHMLPKVQDHLTSLLIQKTMEKLE